MNWNDLQVFLEIYESKTLRAAAKKLNVDQATIARRLNYLEEKLNTKLFIRSRNGVTPTSHALDLIPHLNTIQQETIDIERKLNQLQQEVIGTVKISTTDSLAIEFIIPLIYRLQVKYPKLCIELTTTVETLDLNKAEVDISIRTFRAKEQDLIVKKLAEWEVGLYASKEYINKFGQPNDRLYHRHIVMYQQGILPYQNNRLVGEVVDHSNIITQVNSSLVLMHMINSGSAIGELCSYFAQKNNLQRIWPNKKREQNYEVWLAMHKDSYKTKTVRIVINEIVKIFEKL